MRLAVESRKGAAMTSNDKKLALWLSQELPQGSATQGILFTDIAERVEHGSPKP